jgi:hypothetical protein
MTIAEFNSSLEERVELLRREGRFVVETVYPPGKSAFYCLFDFNVEVIMAEEQNEMAPR